MTTATRTKPTTETLTRRTSTGLVFALSSIGGVEYVVSLSPASCQCAGFTFRRTCRHLTAAQTRYAADDNRRPCNRCGALTDGHLYRHVGGGRDQDLPLCKAGEGCCAR